MKTFDENGITSNTLKGMIMYYTEYPTDQFLAINDTIALANTDAKVVYREDDTVGQKMTILRDDYTKEYEK